MMPPRRTPKPFKQYLPPARRVGRANHLTSLAVIILVAGTIAGTGVHFLSPSHAAVNPYASDTTNPVVSFTAPTTSSVSGAVVPVSVIARDEDGGSGLATVDITLDDSATPLKSFTAATHSFSFAWDTTAVPKGSHTLRAVATDKAGNTATALLTVNIAH